ncbi:phage tail fiber assembly protein [Burkholderia pseudomallei]|nr:phage tail fiber assembly protein [Burkholderia pseudomallei]
MPAELLAREKRDAAMAEFERRLAIARRENLGKADAYAAGQLDDEQTYYFKAWSAYQMALVAAIQKDTFPEAIAWPDTPAPYVPPPPEPVAPEGVPPAAPAVAGDAARPEPEHAPA